ncbi:Uncharacterized protein dnl_22040 [Desulfonema limicola]|uniref:Uncharacterized protein n=1 Tax=Desulfonema limicola TaxID=45656 RepID=A0A975B745_9BACT|nr:hypothetical protein [Desulfonema limicola]QTA79922.1 Uncharacterized protein dnl_22040 [Desulfonema limicola]
MYKWLDDWKRPGTISKALFFIGLIGIIAIPVLFQDTREHPLNWYKKQWCNENNGRIDAPMPDNTSCGCQTDKNVVEFAYADQWHNSIGLALYNSMQTGMKPGIVLIIENKSQEKYSHRLKNTIEEFKLSFDIWNYDLK